MNKQVAGAALAALPVIATVAFGSPAPALANNQPQPLVQNTSQPCGSSEINYSMQISSDDGTTKFQKITLPACSTLPQIILRTPDTNATVKYSPAIADNTKPPKFIADLCAPINKWGLVGGGIGLGLCIGGLVGLKLGKRFK